MKRCPTCNRSYTDDTQKFCLDDGATLIVESPASFDPQATLAMPGAQATSPPSNPYGSGAGQGYSGSGAGQGSYGSSSGQGSYGSGAGQAQQGGSWSPTPQQGFTPGRTPAAKRSMLPWVLGGAAVVVVGLVGLIIVIAIAMSGSSNKNSNTSNLNSNSNSNSGSKSNKNTSASTDIVIKSADGKIQVTVPNTWKSTTELNDKAELQVSDRGNQMYLIVLTDNKADYSDMDLDRHSAGTLETLTKAMTYSNKVGPTKLTIDGNPAVQYEVRGEIKSINVVYLHTTIESADHYQQIVSWTVQSKYSEREGLLKNIISSFKEN